MRPCFAFNAATDTEATLEIYDEIGFWGVQAKEFITQLKGVKAPVLNVEISSPGGDVFAGIAIYNALKASGKEIVVKVMGMAASAASLIAMAGDKIVMPKNSFMMIHNPWSFAMGDADELRAQADVLEKIGGSLLATYAARTGMAEDELKSMLDAETWLSADEALELGFATEVIDAVEAKAKFDMDRADLPENVKAAYLATLKPRAETKVEPEADPAQDDPQPSVEPEAPVATGTEKIVALAKASGMDAYAAAWALAGLDLDTVRARIADAREIKALSVVAGKADLADSAIKAGTSVSDFRASLVAAMAAEDERTHTSGIKPQAHQSQTTGSSEKPPVSSQGLWASHNKHAK
jgi:ATP-dependent Clp endopeptidase proteolytic subunit ClpP